MLHLQSQSLYCITYFLKDIRLPTKVTKMSTELLLLLLVSDPTGHPTASAGPTDRTGRPHPLSAPTTPLASNIQNNNNSNNNTNNTNNTNQGCKGGLRGN